VEGLLHHSRKLPSEIFAKFVNVAKKITDYGGEDTKKKDVDMEVDSEVVCVRL